MSSNFVKHAPPIKKQLTSGTTFLQGNAPKGNINDNYTWKNSRFTSNIGGSNICYPLNENFQSPDHTTTNFGHISNAMHPSSDFNVIKVDLSTQRTYQTTRVDMYYGEGRDLKDATLKYSTLVNGALNFYRNYPVENKYFTISLTNLDTDATQWSDLTGAVTLSKYTQFNPPAQIKDEMNRYEMADLVKEGNDFKNDAIIGRITDVTKDDRLGIMHSDEGVDGMVIWNAGETNDFDLGVGGRPLVLRSDSVLDTGKLIEVEQLIEGGIFADNYILNGTSNVGTFFNTIFVGDMRMTGPQINEGVVYIADADNGKIYNYMDPGAGRSTSLLYIVPNETTAILENLTLSGRLSIEQANNFNLEVVNFTSNTKYRIYKTEMYDSSVEQTVPLDFQLSSNDCLVGSMIGGTPSPTANTFSRMSARINVLEYRDSSTVV